MSKKIAKLPKRLTVFTLAMINVAAVSNLKNWPFTAEYGFAALFYFTLTALVFFFPVSLVSAELASGYTERGGVYLWVKEAFGPKWGFLAVWLQWFNNVFWYPTILSFMAGTVAYAIHPQLAQNIAYTVIFILILFWIATFANFFGMKTSGWISNVGAICGTFIPGAIIIILGFIWIGRDLPIEITFSLDSLIPSFSLEHMVLFTGIMLAFGGMEISAFHAVDVRNPQRDFPRAIFLSSLLILIPSILGVLSIAIVIPKDEISFTAGAMQAFSLFLERYQLQKFVPFVAALISIGVFGSVSTWIIGPTKGLLSAGHDGNLPPLFHKMTKQEVPVNVLLVQGGIVTVLTLVFFLMPTVTSGFWLMTVLTAQLYLIMYALLFAAALRLRYKKPDLKRPYKVPGGKIGMWLTCGIGILSCSFATLIGYIPPAQIEVGDPTFYLCFLISGTLVGCLAPFLITLFQKPNWKKPTSATKLKVPDKWSL